MILCSCCIAKIRRFGGRVVEDDVFDADAVKEDQLECEECASSDDELYSVHFPVRGDT